MKEWHGYYWPLALFACILIIGIPELYWLIKGHTRNTLSWWIWNQLHIAHTQGFETWPAGLFFLFGGWLILVVWLTLHFFFRLFQ